MALHSSTGVHSDVRSDFSTKEGAYRNVKASEHCRPSRQPLFGKELSPVQVSCVSCKGKDELCEWIVFNSGKELYFYPFQGVGKVSETPTFQPGDGVVMGLLNNRNVMHV